MPRWRLEIEEQYIVRRGSWLTLTAETQAEAEALLDAMIATHEGIGLDPVALEESPVWQGATPTLAHRTQTWVVERTDLCAVHRLADPPTPHGTRTAQLALLPQAGPP